MSVVKVENNVVTQIWLDVANTEELLEKYDLEGPEYVEAEGVFGGYTYDGSKFYPPVVKPPTKEEQVDARKIAYHLESDPIFFMAQRGEATMEEWQFKVEEIKARYPYPV